MLEAKLPEDLVLSLSLRFCCLLNGLHPCKCCHKSQQSTGEIATECDGQLGIVVQELAQEQYVHCNIGGSHRASMAKVHVHTKCKRETNAQWQSGAKSVQSECQS